MLLGVTLLTIFFGAFTKPFYINTNGRSDWWFRTLIVLTMGFLVFLIGYMLGEYVSPNEIGK